MHRNNSSPVELSSWRMMCFWAISLWKRLCTLTERLGGWEFFKLYCASGPLYEVFPHAEGEALYPVFPKKFLWVSACNMYTRKAAEFLLKKTSRFCLAADAKSAE